MVPRAWLEEAVSFEVEALLTHEVAHVARHDALANLLQRIVCVPLFFHPGAWIASRRISAAREQLCDAWAVARGTERESYARALASAAERAHAHYAAVSVGIAENRLGLLQRVEAIMDGKSTGRISRGLILAIAVALIGSCAALAVMQFRTTHARGLQAGQLAIGELDLSDLRTALGVAGVSAYRLNYQVPFDHVLWLTVEQYVNGQHVDRGLSESGINNHAGEQSLLVTVNKEEDRVSFWFHTKGAGGGGRAFSLVGYDSFANGSLQTKLMESKAVPVYFYAANRPERGGIRGGGTDSSLDQITHSFDTAIVVFARLERAKPRPETASVPGIVGPVGGPVVDLAVLLANGGPAVGARIQPVGDERTAPSTVRTRGNGHVRFAIEREPRLYENRPREAKLIVTSADGKQHGIVKLDMTPGKSIAQTVRLQPKR